MIKIVPLRDMQYCPAYENVIAMAGEVRNPNRTIKQPEFYRAITDARFFRLGYKKLFIDPISYAIDEQIASSKGKVAARLTDAKNLFDAMRDQIYPLDSNSFRDLFHLRGIDRVMRAAVGNLREAATICSPQKEKIIGLHNEVVGLLERITANQGVIYVGNQLETSHRLNQLHYPHLGLTMSPIAQGYEIASNMARAAKGSKGTLHYHPGILGRPWMVEIHMPLPDTTGIHVNTSGQDGIHAVRINGHDLMVIEAGAVHGYIFGEGGSEKENMLAYITASDPMHQGIWRTIPDAVSKEDSYNMDKLRSTQKTDIRKVNGVNVEARIKQILSDPRSDVSETLVDDGETFNVRLIRANKGQRYFLDQKRESLVIAVRNSGRIRVIGGPEAELNQWDTVIIPPGLEHDFAGDNLVLYHMRRAR